MDYSESSPQPDPEQPQEFISARARRRRAQRRAYFPTDEAERAALFTHLARRAYPSYELFVFSIVSGVILGLGYFLDSQALLIFGILVAPLMTPWIGVSLATIAGSLRFFLQTVMAIFISSLIIFLSGWLAGFASRITPPRVFNEAFIHSRLWWPDIFMVTDGCDHPDHFVYPFRGTPLPAKRPAYLRTFSSVMRGRFWAGERHRPGRDLAPGTICLPRPFLVGDLLRHPHAFPPALLPNIRRRIDIYRTCLHPSYRSGHILDRLWTVGHGENGSCRAGPCHRCGSHFLPYIRSQFHVIPNRGCDRGHQRWDIHPISDTEPCHPHIPTDRTDSHHRADPRFGGRRRVHPRKARRTGARHPRQWLDRHHRPQRFTGSQ
jgi:hypothetical protein